MTLYFAYGSNLGASALRSRCPRAMQVAVAFVDGHRLGFTRTSTLRGGGVADLVPAEGARVWGAVFELDDDDLEALDAYEGAPEAYVRSAWTVTKSDGSSLTASVYVVRNKAPESPPSHTYWSIVVAGAREAGLPADYIDGLEAMDHVPETSGPLALGNLGGAGAREDGDHGGSPSR